MEKIAYLEVIFCNLIVKRYIHSNLSTMATLGNEESGHC